MTTNTKIQPSQIDLDLVSQLLTKYQGNKSAVIRELSSQGWKTGRISSTLGIRYQFAYNTIHRPLKRT